MNAENARKLIEQHDGWRDAYLRNAHGADWDDPLLYDLTINTGRVSPEAAVDLIVGYVRASQSPSAQDATRCSGSHHSFFLTAGTNCSARAITVRSSSASSGA